MSGVDQGTFSQKLKSQKDTELLKMNFWKPEDNAFKYYRPSVCLLQRMN